MQNKTTMKFAILSIALFLMSHTSIAPALPSLLKLYKGINPNIGIADVQQLIAVTGSTIAIGLLLSNLFIAKIGKKNTVLLGLSFIFISGVISFTNYDNYRIVFYSRLILGIGLGLFNSISISIISDYYEGVDRAKMIGYRMVFLNIGKFITTLIAGYTLYIGAQYTFLVYLLVLPIMVMFYFWVDNTEDVTKVAPAKSVVIINKDVIALALITLLIGIAYIGATNTIPFLLENKWGYSKAFSSNLLSFLGLSGIVIGALFGKFTNKFGFKAILIMSTLMGISLLGFTLSNSVPVFYISAFLVATAFTGNMSGVFYYISRTFKKEQINFVTSFALIFGQLGGVLTPIILTKLPQKYGLDIFTTPFYMTSAFMLINILCYSILKNKN
ncbi:MULTISPECIES: MFS transporter [unclassified Gemella]|uniref:MFS transporter n=1 Tax=unclassified Gemella TaxID=2624949 RepID=UPI0010730C79|nr:MULTISPECIES: MFS transporter [unclassified Gemella]MBF0710313.1 MFS transporter [Gemella sp. GL1.1]MBF0746989.1 MFS transporter [Gemella sp. 19428wG2_WT2a]NYS27657.1 MFS transporter [Gemella sp. GL1]TFU58807.1 MFS transporter [Gemella sp. WT2a]